MGVHGEADADCGVVPAGGRASLSIRIEGIPELNHKLGALMKALGDIGAVHDIANQAARLARSYAPVKSGLLQSTIRASNAKNRATVRAGSKNVPYAAVINYGWPRRTIAASGFMQRADDAMRPRIPGLLDAAIRRLIKEGRLS